MAICLQEALSNDAALLKLQIFATDISEKAIAKARSGIYTKNELENVSAARLQQYFTKTDGSYQVNKSIREICVSLTSFLIILLVMALSFQLTV